MRPALRVHARARVMRLPVKAIRVCLGVVLAAKMGACSHPGAMTAIPTATRSTYVETTTSVTTSPTTTTSTSTTTTLYFEERFLQLGHEPGHPEHAFYVDMRSWRRDGDLVFAWVMEVIPPYTAPHDLLMLPREREAWSKEQRYFTQFCISCRMRRYRVLQSTRPSTSAGAEFVDPVPDSLPEGVIAFFCRS